jgi:pyruvate/2-oxoglutarate dehydrogenase complex dihydrolipoamide acyltransferase (E2) component
MKRSDVEPLSEQRWNRVEQELFARLDREGNALAPAPRAPLWRASGLAFAAGACIASLAFWLLAPARFGAEQPQVVQLETRERPERLSVAGHQIEAAPRSSLLVARDAHGLPLIALLHGAAELQVQAPDQRAPAVVRAGNVQLRATFAHFHVALLAYQARVDVRRGVVEVWAPEGKFSVAAGQSWPAPAPSAEAAPVAPAEAEAVPQPETGQAPRATRAAPRRVRNAAAERAPAPSAVAAPVPAAPVAPEPVQAAAAPTGSQLRFEQAARQEGTHPEQAIAIYRELARGRDAWAANALYALGRLELERGHLSAGRTALTDYLARYPGGRNAEDARRLLKRP